MAWAQIQGVVGGGVDERLGRSHGRQRILTLGEAGCDGGRENAPAAVGVLGVDAAAGQLDQVRAIPVDVNGFCFFGVTALDGRNPWAELDEGARRLAAIGEWRQGAV